MSDRSAYLILRDPGFSFARLAGDMEQFGVVLANPTTKQATSLSLEGEQLPTSAREIEAAIENKQEITFQFWIDGDDDLVCELRRRDSFITEWYSFANPGSKRGWLIHLFLNRFVSAASGGGLVLEVLDIDGATAEFDWDEFAKRPERIPIGASVIVLPETAAQDVVAPDDYVRLTVNGLAVWCASELELTVRSFFW